MKSIRGIAELMWIQPRPLRREHELRVGDEVVATLRFPSMFGSLARAESADGVWTFKRSGFLRPRVTARAEGTASEVAVLRPGLTGQGRVESADGGRYRWLNPNFPSSEWVLADETGAPLVHFKPRYVLFKYAADVIIEPRAASLPGLSLLIPLGWYFMILMSESPD